MNEQTQTAGSSPVERPVRQHTPGPWEWMDHSLWGAETGATHDGKTCIECGHSPAECGPSILGVACEELCGDGEDWAPNEADKRLIAAAPDLLAALQELLAAVQRSVCDGSGPAQEAANAAIARALYEA